jgi:hypothetical protein
MIQIFMTYQAVALVCAAAAFYQNRACRRYTKVQLAEICVALSQLWLPIAIGQGIHHAKKVRVYRISTYRQRKTQLQ